ncbi:unnamed protein product [Prunus armeniaca]|uniref:Uncharacterized protein n=1 Tax=Prunus armeniaca TaxID=36596 RepID=A0A6J5UQS1_PRUAR|nr:unnamed protein product [Prunus armeniaca]
MPDLFIGARVKPIQASYGAKQTELMATIEGLRFALDMDVFDLCHSRDGRKRMHNWYFFGGVMQWNI